MSDEKLLTKKTEVKVFMEKLLCPKCKVEMINKHPDYSLATYPPTYVYSCPKCDKTVCTHIVYPKITYEEI